MILRKRQKVFVERSLAALKAHGNSIGIAPTGCHAKGTPILMYNGEIKSVEDIKVGEQLMGPDSRPRTVLELHRGRDEMFEVRPVDGKPFVVNVGHILSLVRDNAIINISMDALLKQSTYEQQRYQLYRAEIEFPLGMATTPKRTLPRRSYFTVRAKRIDDYYGFTVDGDHLYCMEDFTVTHNSGKTIMLSAVTKQWIQDSDKKALILAHRDELIEQNQSKFLRFCDNGISTSVVNSVSKSWGGQATFAMVPTLSRDAQLSQMPPLDLVVIDEAHHAVASTYLKILRQAKQLNPEVVIYGVTASPSRSDAKPLSSVFSNVADQITLAEVIKDGHVVPPKTYIIDLGVQGELKKLQHDKKRTADDFDMNAVSHIMNHEVLNDSVVQHWQEKAGDRKTVVFAATVAHAHDVCKAFKKSGVRAAVIDGSMNLQERKFVLNDFDQGDLQVVINCFVLTEGFDSQPVSCVVLLRPSSYKSTFVQMIGRGLRIVDPAIYPNAVKNDCIVLDFGTSSLIHGTLEQEVNLDQKPSSLKKTCPECQAMVPASDSECPLCGYQWPAAPKNENSEPQESEPTEKILLDRFVMSEIDLLERSSFMWCDLFDDHTATMATGFDAWAGLFYWKSQWYALGGRKKQPPQLLLRGEHTLCLAAADDWLNTYETESAARKSKKWLTQPVTTQQLKYLPTEYRNDYGLNRYHASCLLAFQFNKQAIHRCIFRVAQQEAA